MTDRDLKVMFSSASNDWETPWDVFKKLDDEFHFTLDAAASDSNHKCAKYYTMADDGLSKSWGGRLFSAIPRTEDRSVNGWRKPITNHESQIQQLLCLCLPRRTPNGFTSMCMERQRFVLSKDELNLVVHQTTLRIRP